MLYFYITVQEVTLNNFDMGVRMFSTTNERLKHIDFTLPIIEIETVILAKHPSVETNIYSFLNPFSCEIWFSIVVAFFALMLVLSIMMRKVSNYTFFPKNSNCCQLDFLVFKVILIQTIE